MSARTFPAGKRVAITGLGMISPIGDDLETIWNHISTGKSGIRPLENLPTDCLPFKSGAEVKSFTGDIADYGPLDKALQRAIKKNMKVMCREIEMGVAAAQKALIHSQQAESHAPERCGCLFGCDYILTRPEEYVDGMRNCLEQTGTTDIQHWPTLGLPKVGPLWLLKYLPNMPNSHVSIYNDFRGPNNSITMREASMGLAVAEAASIIRRGAADLMIVGATGSRVHPLRITHVTMIDRLASECDPPSRMARPFDRTCDGMVLGEGAGAVILESWEMAQARGATIWGEVIGHGSAMFGPSPDGRDYIRMAVRNSLQSAIRSAPNMPRQWHVHAHGIGIPQADQSEALAIGDVLQGLGTIPVTTAKSYTGNLGAGSAALELACSILALKHNALFPILNLNDPMPAVTWSAAQLGQPSGSAFVHSSFTQQGQASSLVIAAA
ncbi:MAG: beta-ketoacyl-[acyl-carrier-protein] synthase family protein [Planctomycetales bacterium]|nr:beta-ketoacyl-[acyl-carrier-protein] synthase family protein [Planctomycetales bacterium]